MAAFAIGLIGDKAAREPLVAAWALRWRTARPDSDPQRALELIRPVYHLRRAVIYAGFLARIEPCEWPYHAADVPAALTTAVGAALR